MSLIKKDSQFDLDKKQGPQFDKGLKNNFFKELFDRNRSYFSSIHKLFYGPHGRGPETLRAPKRPRKYTENLPK
jgi:hypothetical protein